MVTFVTGLILGILLMVPVVLLATRRAVERARDAERRALEAERLAELGSMTGGLAHEIKNPLSTIGLNAQLLAESLRDLDIDDEERDRLLRRLDALSREVERLRGILTDFLQFAGRHKLDPQLEDLGAIVTELADFFHPQCDQAHVVMRTQIPSEPITVSVDEAMLKQAILNLMINAVQAMSDASAPDLEAGATVGDLILRVDADDETARVHVVDTGPGIDPDRVDEILRPYVSGRSGGTGLGLPTARRIVEEHGGALTIRSDVGRGSEFVIELGRG